MALIGDRAVAFSIATPNRAVVDIGSNTVRLVIYGGARRAPTMLFNEKVVARLGGELAKTGQMSKQAMKLALDGLKRYRRIITDLHVPEVDVIATAAPRVASNGPKFLNAVREIGFEVELLSGEEEARTSAMGVIGAFPGAKGVAVDLGGASIELIEIDNGKCAHGVSLPLGTLLLPDLRNSGPAKFRRRVLKLLKGEDWDHPVGQTMYMVGGTWRALAAYAMHEAGHPLTDVHGFELSGEEALRLAKHVRLTKPKKLNISRISSMRAEKLPDAAAMLQTLLEELKPDKLVFSAWGVREGRLFDRLDPAARAQDPLLSGVADFCAPRGGPPTLAAQIAAWTVDGLPRNRHGSERVRLAATMLALASMQIEPNLRLRQAINWALYKRWMDLDDLGRAMIAAALSANCGELDLPKALHKLASEEALEEALCWGLGIRLARRLGGGSRRSLRNSALCRAKGKLVLRLGESHADLRADHVEQDLAALAARIGLEPQLEIAANDRMLEGGGFDLPALVEAAVE